MAAVPNLVVAAFRREFAPTLPQRMAASLVTAAWPNCAIRKAVQVRAVCANVLVSVYHLEYLLTCSLAGLAKIMSVRARSPMHRVKLQWTAAGLNLVAAPKLVAAEPRLENAATLILSMAARSVSAPSPNPATLTTVQVRIF